MSFTYIDNSGKSPWGYYIDGNYGSASNVMINLWTKDKNTATTSATYSLSGSGKNYDLSIVFRFETNSVSWYINPLVVNGYTLFTGPMSSPAGWQYNSLDTIYHYIVLE